MREEKVATRLEAFLTRKQQRKKWKHSREAEEETRRQTELEETAARKRRLTKVLQEHPTLKKTLQEIRELDLALPSDLFPQSSLPNEHTCAVEENRFSWKGHPNGLEDRLKVESQRMTPSLMRKESSGSQKEISKKRKSERDSSVSRKLKKDRKTSPEGKLMVMEGPKAKRRMVAAEPQKIKDVVSAQLMRFYDLALEAISKLDTPSKLQIRLVMKKILSRVQIELPTREFFVELSLVEHPIGFSVGHADGLLYIKEFPKGGEATTRAALQRLDPHDSGFPPASFHKKEKLCFQFSPNPHEDCPTD